MTALATISDTDHDSENVNKDRSERTALNDARFEALFSWFSDNAGIGDLFVPNRSDVASPSKLFAEELCSVI